MLALEPELVSPNEVSADCQKISPSDTIFICLGTPLDESNFVFLEYIIAATKQIAEILKIREGYCVVTVKGTVVPDTTEALVIPNLETLGRVQ